MLRRLNLSRSEFKDSCCSGRVFCREVTTPFRQPVKPVEIAAESRGNDIDLTCGGMFTEFVPVHLAGHQQTTGSMRITVTLLRGGG